MWRKERDRSSAEESPALSVSVAMASAANLATSLSASTLTQWPRPASGMPRPVSSPASRAHRLPPSSSTESLRRWSQQGARPVSPQRRLVGPQPFAHDSRRFAAEPKPQGSSRRLERVLGRPSSAWAISSLHPVPGLGHGTRPGREDPHPAREVSKSSCRRSATLTHAAAARPEPGHLVCNHPPDPWCRETPDGPAAHMWLAAAAMPAAAAEAAAAPSRQLTPASTPASSQPLIASSHRRALLALSLAGGKCARPASSPAQRRAALTPAAALAEARRALSTAGADAVAAPDAAADAACVLDEEGGPAKGLVFSSPPCSPKRRSSALRLAEAAATAGAAAGVAAGGMLWGLDGSLRPGATGELSRLMRSLGCFALLSDASLQRLAEGATLRRLERCPLLLPLPSPSPLPSPLPSPSPSPILALTPSPPSPQPSLTPTRYDNAYHECSAADSLYVLLRGGVLLRTQLDNRGGRRLKAPAGFGIEGLMGLAHSRPPPRLESASALVGCECAVVAREHLRAVLRLQAAEEAEWRLMHPGLTFPRTIRVDPRA